MKKLPFSAAMLGLTVLLTACPGPGPTPEATHTLTVTLNGVSSAPVKVTNTSAGATLFEGMLSGSKTFTSLKAGSVLTVTPGNVSGYQTPAEQTVTLNADKTVTLAYKAAQAGTALEPGRLQGTLSNWTYSSGELFYHIMVNELVTKTPVMVPASGVIDFPLTEPPLQGSFLDGCDQGAAFVGAEMVFDLGYASISSANGELLGEVSERTVQGVEVSRAYATSAGQVKGRMLCGSDTAFDFDLNLTKGWNALTLQQTQSGGLTVFTLRSLAAGTPTLLSFVGARKEIEIGFKDTAPLELRRGSSVSRDAVFFQNGGLDGSVSLETDVPGVTITPATITLPKVSGAPALAAQQQGAYRQSARRSMSALASTRLTPQMLASKLTFTASADAQVYQGPLNVFVRQNGQVVGGGRLNNVSLTAPWLYAVLDPEVRTLDLPRGESRELGFTVYSQDSFAGPAVLSLAGLPAGLSATSATVTLTAGGSAHASVRVTASADAPLGSSSARLQGADTRSIGAPDTVTLNVLPSRVTLDTEASAMAPAPDGSVWVMATSPASVPGTTLRRVSSQGIVQRESLPPMGTLLTSPNGDAVVVTEGQSYSGMAMVTTYTVTRVTASGTRSSVSTQAPEAARLKYGAVDDAGFLWFINTLPTGTTLAKMNLTTGQVTDISTGLMLSGQESLVISPDGRTLYIKAAYGMPSASRVNTATAAVTPVSMDQSNIPLNRADNAGNLWGAASGQLYRMDSSGHVSVSPVTGTSFTTLTLLGVDRTTPDLMWISTDQSVLAVSGTGSVVKTLPLRNVGVAAPATQGGAWVVTSESVLLNGSWTLQTHVSLLN